MNLDDIIAEIYGQKSDTITDEISKIVAEETKNVKSSKIFGQVESDIHKITQIAKRNNLDIRSGYSTVDPEDVRVCVDTNGLVVNIRKTRNFDKRFHNLKKEFLKLKLAIATAGKSDQKELIEAFNKMVF